MITPIRGRKHLRGADLREADLRIRNDNPDKGTETALMVAASVWADPGLEMITPIRGRKHSVYGTKN